MNTHLAFQFSGQDVLVPYKGHQKSKGEQMLTFNFVCLCCAKILFIGIYFSPLGAGVAIQCGIYTKAKLSQSYITSSGYMQLHFILLFNPFTPKVKKYILPTFSIEMYK